MSGHKLPDDFLPLVELLVAGTIDDAEFARLDEILSSDANARRLYRRYMNLHAAMPALVGNAPVISLKLSDHPGDQISDRASMPDAEFIRLLLEVEASGQSVDLVDATELLAQRKRETARPSFIAPLPLIAGGIAAVLVLAITLTFVLTGGSTPPGQNTAGVTIDKPLAADAPDAQPTLTVATLTATRNAKWSPTSSEQALARGSQLHPGDRLTLTSGYAEITTVSGAVAIIEAPATVQLTDSDNAIRLHAGKLVGICETPSSKGFLVRTPHMDVIDLGTRFGVDVTDPESTQTHVLEGVVLVARPSQADDASASQRLKQGEGAIASASGIGMKMIAAEPQRFASIMPRRIDLLGTGHGLTVGDIDPNWQVTAVDGIALVQDEFLKVGSFPIDRLSDKPRNDPAVAQWLLGNHIIAERTSKQCVFTCKSFFELPAGVDPDDVALVLRFDADESLERVRLNGQVFQAPENSWDDEHTGLNSMRIDRGFTTGINSIELDVLDLVRGGGTQWSLYLQWHLETIH
ncbi:MAG: FecR domain-containing protein [Phycisphaeraceae bacterium]